MEVNSRGWVAAGAGLLALMLVVALSPGPTPPRLAGGLILYAAGPVAPPDPVTAAEIGAEVSSSLAGCAGAKVRELVLSNLDDDPLAEVAALLDCVSGVEVVAFERDEQGKAVYLGEVAYIAEPREMVQRLSPRRPDGVVIEVGDGVQRQSREFAFDQGRFRQVEGPFVFPRTDDQLLLAVSDLRLGVPGRDGWREGSVRVSVTNQGGKASSPFRVVFPLTVDDMTAEIVTDTWAGYASDVPHDALGPGQTVSVELIVRIQGTEPQRRWWSASIAQIGRSGGSVVPFRIVW